MNIDISEIPRELILANLFNLAQPIGLGWQHYSIDDMELDQACSIVGLYNRLDVPLVFDYIEGRPIHSSLRDSFDPTMYDRYNGAGSAIRAIDNARSAISDTTSLIERERSSWEEFYAALAANVIWDANRRGMPKESYMRTFMGTREPFWRSLESRKNLWVEKYQSGEDSGPRGSTWSGGGAPYRGRSARNRKR